MRKNKHTFKRAITTAYLIGGLSVSSGQNEVKPKIQKSKTSSEKIDKQRSPDSSDPLLLRIDDISHKIRTKAANDAVDAAIRELNSREALSWGEAKLAPQGFNDDATVFKVLDQKLGDKYSLKITATEGSIIYQGGLTPGPKVTLKRTPSTATSPGSWERTSKKPAN